MKKSNLLFIIALLLMLNIPIHAGVPNLVGWYKLDDGSGSTASDSSGKGYNGTLIDMESADWVAGIYDNALNFDGTSEKIQLPDVNEFDFVGTGLSWSMWVKTTATSGQVIMSKTRTDEVTAQGDKRLYMTASGTIQVLAYGVSGSIPSTGTINDGNWHHIAMTISFNTNGANDTLKLYIDGVQDGENTSTRNINQFSESSYVTMIGNGPGTGFNGTIDNVQIYNRALPDEEIYSLYEPNLVGLYKLNEATGTIIDDFSVYNHDGTIANFDSNNCWVTGINGNALQFDGIDDVVNLPVTNDFSFDNGITWAMWVKIEEPYSYALMFKGPDDFSRSQGDKSLMMDDLGHISLAAYGVPGAVSSSHSISDGQWHHVAVTVEPNTLDSNDTIKTYIDGYQDGVSTNRDITLQSDAGLYTYIGGRRGNLEYAFRGVIDDVKIYNHPLDANSINSLYGKAGNPSPTNNSIRISTNTNLSWSVLFNADSHDVYLGTSYAAVTTATRASTEYKGQVDTNSYYPGTLSSNRQYYWRIDELDEANNVISTGLVWTFKTTNGTILSNYYVSADGNDFNPGTIESPFATITAARDKIRYGTHPLPSGGVTVWIRGGTYYIDKTVEFTNDDSGDDANNIVTYVAYNGEKPVFCGGKEITGWSLDANNIYKVYIDDVKQGKWRFDQIFENDIRAIKARTPNSSYLYVNSVTGIDANAQFEYAAGDLPSWPDYSDAQVFIFVQEQAFSSTIPISNINTISRTITLASKPYNVIGVNDRYFIQGIKNELDSNGEFYLDESTGYLYYWPISTPISQQTIIAPVVENIFEIKGTNASKQTKYITFEGLALTCSQFCETFDEQGSAYNHMFNRPGFEYRKGLIRTENSSNVIIKNCNLYNAGFSGIALDIHSDHHTIYGNTMRDCGYHGILLTGQNPGVGIDNSSSQQVYDNHHHMISNNHINNCGKLVGHGTGIFAWQSGDNEISYNLIHKMPRYGIGFKSQTSDATYGTVTPDWNNRFDIRTARNNVVKFNHVYQVNADTQDCGGISFKACGKDNMVENNRVHDIHVPTDTRGMAQGIYFDDCTFYATASKNIVYDITGNIYQPIICRSAYNTITNNIFVSELGSRNGVFCSKAAGNGDQTFGYHNFSKNIWYTKTNGTSGTFYYFSSFTSAGSNMFTFSDNQIFYLDNGGTKIMYGIPGDDTFTNWKTLYNNKWDQNSITSNPLFENVAYNDFTLDPCSPAYSMGFEDINQSDIGLKSDFPASHSPAPYDNQITYVPTDVYLNWAGNQKADSFDVYLGTSFDEVADANHSSAEFKGNQAGTTYNPGTLLSNTDYYWKINDVNDLNVIHVGDVWHFKTENGIDVNLVGWWKFDEGSGSNAADSSGKGHNGTLIDMESGDWVGGITGDALVFDGTTERVVMPDVNDLDFRGAGLTWSLWVKTSATVSQVLMSKSPTNRISAQGDKRLHMTSTGTIELLANSVGGAIPSTGSINDGQWHHVAMTIKFNTSGSYDTIKLYIDGQQDGGETNTRNIDAWGETGYVIMVGNGPGTGFNGTIDDVRIYNRDLTDNQIYNMYQAGL